MVPRMQNHVEISGNLSRTSPPTRRLFEAIVSEAAGRDGWKTVPFDLIGVGPTLGATVFSEKASPAHRQIWDAAVSCDALGTPVYETSYIGLPERFFDQPEPALLATKPVMLCATGKAPPMRLSLITSYVRFLLSLVPGRCPQVSHATMPTSRHRKR
jgi:FMN reductase